MNAKRPARRNFWLLATVATVAMGTLSQALTAPPGPLAGVAVATSTAVLAISIALAARILVRLNVLAERGHRPGARVEGPGARGASGMAAGRRHSSRAAC